MQKWEYLQILAAREAKKGFSSGLTEWDNVPDLRRLGEEGWELVSVVPMSSVHGETFAGLTTERIYIFKRPKD